MGEWFQVIVDRDATLAEAEELANSVVGMLVNRGIIEAELSDCILDVDKLGHGPGPNFETVVNGSAEIVRTLWTNGLDVIFAKTVFDSGQGGFDLVCTTCGTRILYDNIDQSWSDAIQEWYDGTGKGLVTCPNCGNTESITEWRFDPPWGFGNLGFRFWNWPQLEVGFVEEIGSLLRHRIAFVAGKL